MSKIHRRVHSGVVLAVLTVVLLALVGRVPLHRAVSTDDAASVRLPVLMYHGILPDGHSGLGDYVVSVSEFESDLRYLADHGYQTVGMREVIDYVKNGTPLPQNALILTFDDGYYNNYLYAYPLLQKYSARMVLSPICKWSDVYSESGEQDARYTHITWEQMREMVNSGLVEVQNHTYDLHTISGGRKGSGKKKGETVAAYQQLLSTDLNKAQERFAEELGQVPTTFTYPFGEVSNESVEVLRTVGFEAALTCEEKVNTLTRDTACLYRLGRFRRPHGVSTTAFLEKILN